MLTLEILKIVENLVENAKSRSKDYNMFGNSKLMINDPAWGHAGLTAVSFASSAKFDKVCFIRNKHEIIKSASFELGLREIICLVGPSGCGKTTILRLLAGAERASSGCITIDQNVVSDRSHFSPPERRNVGIVFQDYLLFPHMSVIDNVLYGLHKFDKFSAQILAMNALERVGLREKIAYLPQALSGGEQQRVALARAIAPRPAIMLLDEPFSSLDQKLRREVRKHTFAILRETRSSCIIVTHDPEEALAFADRIIVMREGRIIQIGSPVEVYQSPVNREVAEYFSVCNILNARRTSQGIETPIGVIPYNDINKTFNGSQVLFRLLALEPCDPSTGHICRVEGKIFEGEFTRLRIVVDDSFQPLWTLIPSTLAAKIGDYHHFRINPEQVIYLN